MDDIDDKETPFEEDDKKKKDTFPYELVTNEQGLDYLKCIWSEIHDE